MVTVSVRVLKSRLGELLRRVADGEQITVTDRGRPVAMISPPTAKVRDEGIVQMVRAGLARSSVGKPLARIVPPRLRSKSTAPTALGERR